MNNAAVITQEEFAAKIAANIKALTTDCVGTINAGLDFQLVDCDLEEQSVTVSLEIRPWMCNPAKSTVHGGISAALADHVLGTLLYTYSGAHLTSTVNLQMTYLKPVKTDRRLFMKAYITGCGHKLCSAMAEAWSEGEQKLAYTACGTFYLFKA